MSEFAPGGNRGAREGAKPVAPSKSVEAEARELVPGGQGPQRGRQDPVRQARKLAASQIQRSLKAWRDRPNDEDAAKDQDEAQSEDVVDGAAQQPAPAEEKVHRAEDPSKANAALSRLGNSGQDKAALRTALLSVKAERDACKEQLTILRGRLSVLGRRPTDRAALEGRIDSALNNLNTHLSDTDITGAMRDTAGDPVRQAGTGRTWDHLQEVRNALNSLVNLRADLARVRQEMERGQLEPANINGILGGPLSSLQTVVQAVQAALRKIQ